VPRNVVGGGGSSGGGGGTNWDGTNWDSARIWGLACTSQAWDVGEKVPGGSKRGCLSAGLVDVVGVAPGK